MWRIFKTTKQIKEELLAEIAAEDAAQKQRELEALREVEEQLRKDEELRLAAEEQLKNSAEPWVDIKGIVEDPEQGVKIELDWNDAFIAYLKENGYTGADDDQIIQQYVVRVMQDMNERMLAEQNMQSAYE